MGLSYVYPNIKSPVPLTKMPTPREDESKDEFIERFMSSGKAKQDYPDEEQRYAVAESMWREHSKKGKETRQHLTLSQITVKGDFTQTESTVQPNQDLSQMSEAAEEEAESGDKVYTSLVATTHPDRVGDMLSVEAIKQIAEYINKDSIGSVKSGGGYRSISLYHDWVNEEDPTLDEVAFVLPNSAREVTLSDGHYGCEVDFKINKYYRGEMTPEEIEYRIENGAIAGLSIEYRVDDNDVIQVSGNDGSIYNFIKRIKDYAGQALARARMIANPAAVIYKEIANQVKESLSEDQRTPPEQAKKNAQKVLDWKDEHGDEVKGMTETGWKRARQLADGGPVSTDVIKKMAQFNRHRDNSNIDDKYENEPWKDNGYVAWLGWGGDAGIDWAIKMSKKIDSKEVHAKMAEEKKPEQPKKPEEEEETKKEYMEDDKKKKKKAAKGKDEDVEEEEEEDKKKDPEQKEQSTKDDNLKIKEILESKEFKQKLEEVKVDNKVIKEKEENKMDGTQLKIKEMNQALKEKDTLSFKERASELLETKEAENAFKQGVTFGKPTLKVKADGRNLRVVGDIKTKDTLDTATNTEGTYSMNIVEFNDVFVPGLIETFNQVTDTFNVIEKKDNLAGTNNYGWRITTDQETSFAVDPDDPTITKVTAGKEKLQTDMKVYRKGVSVTDYMLEFSRAAIGDLLQLEANKQMADMRKAINRDMFTAQTDSGNKILGLPAVADSSTYSTLYGKSRTTSNRLKHGTIANTYEDISGNLTTARLREAISYLEVEGSRRGDIIIVCGPNVRDDIFELLGGQQQLFEKPAFGFEGAIRFDGVPVLPDSDCASDSLFVIDKSACYAVVGKAPQMTGLAKVGAAEEAYVETYLAHVYEQPRRIVWLDGLTRV